MTYFVFFANIVSRMIIYHIAVLRSQTQTDAQGLIACNKVSLHFKVASSYEGVQRVLVFT